MKVLVTGGTGFIGSHTVVELQQAGYEVVVIDNLENSHSDVAGNISQITGKPFTFINADIRDRDALDSVFAAHSDIRAVIHFAAYKAVGESVKEPLKYYSNNVGGTVNLLDIMQKHGINNFVFSSSCTVYGDVSPDQLPITEASPVVKANSPYGNTKKICEELLQDACAATPSLQVVSLRYFNPIGAHDSTLIGELPIGVPNNLIPFITQTAIGKREKITVFGNDYPTSDGTCVRDYIHVVDLAIAHVKAIALLERGDTKTNFSLFNIGTGKGNSVLEVIHTFEKENNVKLNYTIGPRRAGDVVKIYASCDKAEKELGWKAGRSLADALKSAWAWEKKLSTMIPKAFGTK